MAKAQTADPPVEETLEDLLKRSPVLAGAIQQQGTMNAKANAELEGSLQEMRNQLFSPSPSPPPSSVPADAALTAIQMEIYGSSWTSDVTMAAALDPVFKDETEAKAKAILEQAVEAAKASQDS